MRKRPIFYVTCVASMMCYSFAFAEEPAQEEHAPLPTVAEARQQSKILHEAMHATLQFVHHEYYKEDEGIQLPAATLKKVFTELEKEHQIKLRWLAVEGQTMNTDHDAQNDFEKKAVAALKSGKDSYEEIDSDTLHRVGAIALTNHCLKCHVPDRKSTEVRRAGLIISIPVRKSSQVSE